MIQREGRQVISASWSASSTAVRTSITHDRNGLFYRDGAAVGAFGGDGIKDIRHGAESVGARMNWDTSTTDVKGAIVLLKPSRNVMSASRSQPKSAQSPFESVIEI